MAKTYPEKISLNGDRKLINAVKKSGLKTMNPQGEYNGYGYEKLEMHVVIESPGDKKKYNAVVKELQGAPVKPKKTENEKKEVWSKRLSKLTGIPIEEAREIADEKIQFKERKIEEIEDRQNDHRSRKRETLLKKMERENPLRRIEDEDHALAILAASDRHRNTNYNSALDQARYLADRGEIDRSEVKDWARQNKTRYKE